MVVYMPNKHLTLDLYLGLNISSYVGKSTLIIELHVSTLIFGGD